MDKTLIAGGRAAEVLLIDDNRGDAMLAAHAFKSSNVAINLSVASDGETALRQLDSEAEKSTAPLPDLILLDMGLPRMSGSDVLVRLKNAPRLKHIPVIVMSNSGSERNILESYRQYANAYVIKPIDLDGFRQALGLIEKFFFVLARVPAVQPA